MENQSNGVNNNYRSNCITKKDNKFAIISFVLSIIEIHFNMQIIYSYYLKITGHVNYMWQLGVVAMFVIIILPLSVLSIIMGAIGIAKAGKLEKGYAYKWMAIFGLASGISIIVLNILGFRYIM